MVPNAQQDEGSMKQRGGRIMVIDDSFVVRKILAIGLARAGFEVECYEDGVEALRSLQDPERQELPDLVILDIVLPKMDGYEIAVLLRSRPELSRIVIVVLSRRDGILDRLKGRLAGASAYIMKPFRMSEVVQVVSELLQTTGLVSVPNKGDAI
jgi:twitching motility two-component system response regulator PilG